jgi:hypothetical protein
LKLETGDLKVSCDGQRHTTVCILHGGVRCPHNFRYLYAVWARGHVTTGRPCHAAHLTRPPNPATQYAPTLGTIAGQLSATKEIKEMKTRTFIRIILSIAIVVITSLIFIVFASIAGTSHNISAESRDNAITRGF